VATPEESAKRIESEFATGKRKVDLSPDEVQNWHTINSLLAARNLRHINMSGSTTGTITPYAINASHHSNPVKSIIRMFKKLISQNAT
jgi:hypothetical protein